MSRTKTEGQTESNFRDSRPPEDSFAIDPNVREIVDDYVREKFDKEYDLYKAREIWRRQSERFRDFWESRIMKAEKSLSDADMIPIIRILDRQGKITTEEEKRIEGTAFAGVFQSTWYELFRRIQSSQIIKRLVDRTLKAGSDEEQAKLLDELEQENTTIGWLTGQNATVINDFIFAFAPEQNISVLSLSDRYKIIEFFGLGKVRELEKLTWGDRILATKRKILSLIDKLHLQTDGRGLCHLLYSDKIKILWKQQIVESTNEGKRREIGLWDTPKYGHIVGKPINFRGMTYGPTEENGVIFLFSKITSDLGMMVQSIQKDFPDAEVVQYHKDGRGHRLFIEFEYLSSHFPQHNHLEKMRQGTPCHMIVCWEHDWKECPSNIKVLALKEWIKELPNETP